VTVYSPPPAPASLEETGVGHKLLFDLMLKVIHVEGLSTVSQLAARSRLPVALVGDLVEEARSLALMESLGTRGRDFAAELRFALTGQGQQRANEALARSQYVGPAPVSLEAFREQVDKQRLTNERVGPDQIRRSCAHLVLPEDLLARLGPAANSGRSILLYGSSGNGKTTIAQALAGAFEDVIAVPHCIAVDGQIISFFDPHVHAQVTDGDPGGPDLRLSGGHDRRWVACRRPVTVVGGELTLDMLDLIHNPGANFYEAPAHLKVSGGVFVIDDFGRQRTSPASILNRWIVPLERGVDYLSLHTGKKFAVPFDGLVVFSTNMTPSDVADQAMLRRLYYKVEVPEPTVQAYARIWANLCARRNIPLPIDLVPFLEQHLYAAQGMARAGYHPTYLLEQVAAMCEYQGRPLRLDKTLISLACQNMCAR
jgi:hypothetical protein